ncbi:TetR/AcrR family transcriptional regulator [Mycobacterium sp. 3519A]|uniref:TetR/AcrR family transcriptional regulator n=1 Tax=Mycobacterium sp. 3519A TaxID=2057184 RepID=UPI001F43DE6E|nr:TetR/AcrR family transcriptional regulator [Mycobacterium sp. 3519A]
MPITSKDDAGETLGDRIRLVIRSLEISQREFAERIGMDPTALSKALAGIRRLSEDEVAAIAGLGNVSRKYLMTGTGRRPRIRTADGVTKLRERSEAINAQARRAQIVESTARLIARRGFHNVRVADIAEACGTSSATIHHYFPSKRHALRAALDHYAERLFARLEAEFEKAGDTVDKLRRLIEVQLITTEQDADEWSIWIQSWNEAILHSELRDFQHNVYGRWRGIVLDLVRSCQREGIGTTADAETLVSRFTSMVDGLAIQLLAGTADVSTETMRDLLLDAFEPHISLRKARKKARASR